MDEHLLLASFVFPLIVKKILQDHELYTLTECDEVCIEAFDELAVNPFGRIKSDKNVESWQWNKVIAGKKWDKAFQKARPTSGELCNECKSKESRGQCKK